MVTVCPAGPGGHHQESQAPRLRQECRPQAVTAPGLPRTFWTFCGLQISVSLHSRLPAAEALSFQEPEAPWTGGVARCGSGPAWSTVQHRTVSRLRAQTHATPPGCVTWGRLLTLSGPRLLHKQGLSRLPAHKVTLDTRTTTAVRVLRTQDQVSVMLTP